MTGRTSEPVEDSRKMRQPFTGAENGSRRLRQPLTASFLAISRREWRCGLEQCHRAAANGVAGGDRATEPPRTALQVGTEPLGRRA